MTKGWQMASDDEDQFEDDAAEAADEWEEFRGEGGAPISIEELKRLKLLDMPEDIRIWVWTITFQRQRYGVKAKS
jgi:hypothetical protein